MDHIETLDDLLALYGTPGIGATIKVRPALIPSYRTFIERSRFCILSTVGPEGTDGTPRGDEAQVVTVLDDRTLAMPDWTGNERVDNLRNIIRDGRVSLLFLIAGSKDAIRVNGKARLTTDDGLRNRFARNGQRPRLVVVIRIAEVYSQCPKALNRAALWSGDASADLPTPADSFAEIKSGAFDALPDTAIWPDWV
jgi:PPOX class probable FMN-dependent enzyme